MLTVHSFYDPTKEKSLKLGFSPAHISVNYEGLIKYKPGSDFFHFRVVEECLIVRDIVEPKVVVG